MGNRRKAVIGLGMFDGMHLGHRDLVSRCVEHAGERNCSSVIYTFRNHPFTVFGGEIRLLSDPEERAKIMYGLGTDQVVMEEFTPQLCALTPKEFILGLMERWEILETVVGFNYTFGARGAGTPESLMELGEQFWFEVSVMAPVLYRGEPVSSTRIRNLLETGNMGDSAAMLTHPYRIRGKIVHNRHLGHAIGFPTANLDIPENRVIPQRGVYASRAVLFGKRYPAVTNIGTDPTVGGKQLSIETYLIGFEGNIYGAELEIEFLSWIRSEERFASMEELSNQIRSDIAEAERRASGTL